LPRHSRRTSSFLAIKACRARSPARHAVVDDKVCWGRRKGLRVNLDLAPWTALFRRSIGPWTRGCWQSKWPQHSWWRSWLPQSKTGGVRIVNNWSPIAEQRGLVLIPVVGSGEHRPARAPDDLLGYKNPIRRSPSRTSRVNTEACYT